MRKVQEYTIEQFRKTYVIRGLSFSPDERSILCFCNSSGIMNAYKLIDTSGELQPLTTSTTQKVRGITYFPDGERILLVRDNKGDEKFHHYVLCQDGCEVELFPGASFQTQYWGLSYDEKFLYFAMNDRDQRCFDLYKVSVSDLERTLFYNNTEGLVFGCISRDEYFVALTRINTSTNSDIFLYDAVSGEQRCLTEGSKANNHGLTFNPTSRLLYYLTNESSDFFYIAQYDLVSGTKSIFRQANYDMSGIRFSHSGRYRIISFYKDTYEQCEIFDQLTNQLVVLPDMPEGEISAVSFSKSDRLMVFHFNNDRSPGDLYLYNLPVGKLRRLTNSLNAEIDAADLVESRCVRYNSFDGLEIPALLWKPHQASAEKKAPALIWVHGGPGGRTRRGYDSKIQFFVNHGYVILAVNHRGSSGYGKSFLAAADHKYVLEPLMDCVEGKSFLSTLDYVDISSVGIYGASFGGYMVLAALAFMPEAFALGIDLFGSSNLVRMLRSLPRHLESLYRNALYSSLGDPDEDEERLRSISPLFYAHRITKPLLVLQGANDPRVPRIESDEMVEAVRKSGGIVEYLVFEDEGHGITKRANAIRACQSILTFLDTYLKKTPEHARFSLPAY